MEPIDWKVIWTDEKKERVLNLIEEYLEQHFSGEHIYQSDEAQVEAIELLSEIADFVEPEYIGE